MCAINILGDTMTTVYLMRHSKCLIDRVDLNTNETFQVANEKYILSVEGERRALEYSKLKELKDLNMVISGNYVRSMSTAKYIAFKNKLPVTIDENFNGRKFGIEKKEDIPADFFKKQVLNKDYKLDGGESFNEVKTRMLEGLKFVLSKNKGGKILIVSHSSAIAALVSKWCNIKYDKKYFIKFKNKIILNGFDAPELLELKFDDKNKLVNIRRIRSNKLKYNFK